MDLDELYRFLRCAHLQAQAIIDTIRNPLLVLETDLTVISANPAFYETFDTNREQTIGVPFDELGNGQWNIEELTYLLQRVIPKSASVFDYEVTTKFPHVGHRTMLVSAQRLKHPDSDRRVLLLSVVDATKRQQQEDEKDILIGELDHRIKNLLSVTQSLARQTKVEGRTAEEYRDVFLGRFEALSRSMEMTIQKKSADLGELAHTVMQPFFGTAHTISVADGPCVSLTAKQATSLGMILHELTTNAVKHGALSVPDGQLVIDWAITSDEGRVREVHLCWEESKGPEVVPPAARGFGTRLIDVVTEQELGGRVEPDYRPEGFVTKVMFPLQGAVSEDAR